MRRLTSPFGSFTTATITCNVRMNTGQTQRKARIIFGYTSSTNYRYVEFDDVANRVNICEILNGRTYTRAYASYTFSSATWYAVTVTVASNGTVYRQGWHDHGKILRILGSCRTGRRGIQQIQFRLRQLLRILDCGCVGRLWEMGDGRGRSELCRRHSLWIRTIRTRSTRVPIITYSLTASADVELVVINVLGQQIRTLVNEYQSAGDHSVVWDGRDQGGNQVASGIYFYRMTSAGSVDTKKMLLMK